MGYEKHLSINNNINKTDFYECENLYYVYSRIYYIITELYASIVIFVFMPLGEGKREDIINFLILIPFIYLFFSSLIKLKNLIISLSDFSSAKLILSKEGFYVEDKYVKFNEISSIFYFQFPLYDKSKIFFKYQFFIMRIKVLNYIFNFARVFILFSAVYFLVKKEILIGLILLFILTYEVLVKYISVLIMSKLLGRNFKEINRYKGVLIIGKDINYFFIFTRPECVEKIIHNINRG